MGFRVYGSSTNWFPPSNSTAKLVAFVIDTSAVIYLPVGFSKSTSCLSVFPNSVLNWGTLTPPLSSPTKFS